MLFLGNGDANVSGEWEMMMGMQIWMGNGRIMMGDAKLDWGIPMVDAKWGMGMKMGNSANPL